MGLRDSKFSAARFTPREGNSMNINNSTTTGNRTTTPNYSNPYTMEVTCYGCGEKGHVVSRCPEMGKLLTEGSLMWMEQGGYFIMLERAPLRKWGTGTLVNTYEN